MLNDLLGLQKTIHSIEKQTFGAYEVWIVDGGSEQDAQAYFQSLQPPFYVVSEKGSSIYDAMNAGVALANADWMYFLGAADCLSTPTVLSEIQTYLDPSLSLVYGNITYGQKVFHSRFSAVMWFKNTLHHQGAFYHKTIFEKYKYATAYKILGDYDLNLQLLKDQVPARKVDVIVAHCDEQGVSKKYTRNLYQEEYHLKKNKLVVLFRPLIFLLVRLKFFKRRLFQD